MADSWQGFTEPNRRAYQAWGVAPARPPQSAPPQRPTAQAPAPQRPSPRPSATPAGQPSQPPAQAGSQSGLAYQSGVNPNQQAVNLGGIMDRHGRESRLAGVTSGAARDFAKGQQREDAANLNRGIKQQNAQQNMVEQANRSELFQAGLAQQVDMQSKLMQHRTAQSSMAADWFQKMMQSREALMGSLMK